MYSFSVQKTSGFKSIERILTKSFLGFSGDIFVLSQVIMIGQFFQFIGQGIDYPNWEVFPFSPVFPQLIFYVLLLANDKSKDLDKIYAGKKTHVN